MLRFLKILGTVVNVKNVKAVKHSFSDQIKNPTSKKVKNVYSENICYAKNV